MKRNILRGILSLIITAALMLAILPAGGLLVSADNKGIAGAEGVYAKLISLKTSFPDGKYWNHQVTTAYNNGDQLLANNDESFANNTTFTPCATHSGTASIGEYDCNVFDGGMQCWGFACKIFYDTFGERVSSLGKRTDTENISVGDYLRYGTDKDGHSAVVLTRNGDSITVVECNNGAYGGYCNIHWGGASSISSVSYFKHSTKWDEVNNTPVTPSATFYDWSNDKYTFIGSTNAAIGQEVITSGGSFTEVGMILYDANGNQLGSAGDPVTSSETKYYYKINEEVGVGLSPNTVYKYKFYAVVGGRKLYSQIKSFRTLPINITFSDWSNDNYTYIGKTDASIGQEVSGLDNTGAQLGMVLYNSVKDRIGSAYGYITANTRRYYFKINEELGVTLTPGTLYYYRFYAVLNGETYYSEYKSFTTLPDNTPVNMSWSNSFNMPSKTSAYVSAKAVADNAGTFSSVSLKVWNSSGKLIVSKTDEPFSKVGTSQVVIYDIYAETGVLLQPSSTYRYQFTVTYNGKEYTSESYYFETESEDDLHFGIDISSHQGYIEWEKVSKHIDFAIIRCGYGSDYQEYDDAYWEYNASECERLGIPYGVYLYSYAENDNEARNEAQHALRLLKNHRPSLPVYLDLEDNATVGQLSELQLYRQADIFRDMLSASGYRVGIYASYSWWNGKLSSTAFSDFERWTAAYGDFYPQCTEWDLWQYSSSGNIPGINGSVDIDYSKAGVIIINTAAKGDADGDGSITVADALAALRVAAKLAEETPEMLAVCDTDGDGAVTVADALAILRVAAKLADSL